MTDIMIAPSNGVELHTTKFTPSQIELIKSTVAKDCTDDEFSLFLYQCSRRGLDPMVSQIHAVKRGGKMVIQTGIGGFRLIANRTGRYVGRLGPMWCGEDGVWKDVWLGKGYPAAAKVGVRTINNPEGSWNVALWSEYVQFNGDGKITRMWDEKGALMLAKCAESGILRAEFPEELSGLYTDDEMGQADNPRLAVRSTSSTQARRGEVIDRPRQANHAPARNGAKPITLADFNKLVEECLPLGIVVDDMQPNAAPAHIEGRYRNLSERKIFAELAGEAKKRGREFEPLPAKCTVAEIQKHIDEVKDFLTGLVLPEVPGDEAEVIDEAM